MLKPMTILAILIACASPALAIDINNNLVGIFERIKTIEARDPTTRYCSVTSRDISSLTDTSFDKEVLNRYIKAVDETLEEIRGP